MMNDLSINPTHTELGAIERRARQMRARAVADASRWTWKHLAGVFKH